MNQSEKREAKESAGAILVEGINSILDTHSSPVENGRFKSTKADGKLSSLFKDGDMRSQITFEELETDHVEVGIFGNAPTVEKLKAYNHNVGDTLPVREFIAKPNKRFKKSIMDKVNASTERIREEAKSRKKEEDDIVEDILTPDDLLDILG